MTPTRTAALALLVLGGCAAPDYTFSTAELELEVTSPAYGEFLGDDAAVVAGRVNLAGAVVTVEGVEVEIGEGGAFQVEVSPDHAYRNIDIVATAGGTELRERIPVFRGHDPMETWPGGITARVLPEGLEVLGEKLGLTLDEMGWADQIAASLPEVSEDWITMTPAGVSHDDTTVELIGVDTGLDTAIALNDVSIDYDTTIDVYGYVLTGTTSVGFEQIRIGTVAIPAVDEDGMLSLTLDGASVDFDDADITLVGIDGWLLEWIVDGISGWITEPLAELLGSYVLDQYGYLELGGPFDFETDLMGTDIAAALNDVYGDTDGLGLGMGVAMGSAVSDGAQWNTVDMMTPTSDGISPSDAQVVLALHEGLFQTLLTGELLDMLTQEFDLSGTYGDILGAGLKNIPGGDDMPDGDGYCISIQPGEARVARLQTGISPLAYLYLPDLQFQAGVLDGSSCEDWLHATLAFEIGLLVEDGTKLSMDMAVAEGAVLYYGAPDYDEAEVVEGLGDYMGGLMSLLGGAVEFDLADLMGGLGDMGGSELGVLLGDLEPEITGSTSLYDANDADSVEGLYAITLDLWND